MQHLEVALGVAVVSVGVKEGLYWATRGVGERYHNSLMKANAWHHRSDAVSSVAAAVGVGEGPTQGSRGIPDPIPGQQAWFLAAAIPGFVCRVRSCLTCRQVPNLGVHL